MEFRPLEMEDVRYVWAAYKKGALENLGFDGDEMSAAEFKDAFAKKVLEDYDAAWTQFGTTSKGYIPVGLIFGFWPHATKSPYMIVADMVWFPWATRRNVVESVVNFFNDMRKDIPMVEYARPEDKKLYETVCKHGIMRRVGTSHVVYPEIPATVFETRSE